MLVPSHIIEILIIAYVVNKEEEEDWSIGEVLFFIFLGVILFGCGFLGVFTIATPIHIFWLVVGIERLIYFLICLLSSGRFRRFIAWFFTKKDEGRYYEYSASWKAVPTVIILVVMIVLLCFIPRNIAFKRATDFKGYVNSFESGSIDMFPEIAPADIRLTTSDIARSIAETKKTSAASVITSVHLGQYNGELSWICTISERPILNLLIGDANKIREIIMVPLNDATGQRVTIMPFEASYSEGLWLDRGMAVHANDVFPMRTFTRAYITSMENEMVVVTTSFIEIPFGSLTDPMVHVWNPLTGDLIAEYTPTEAPEWLIQRWDESFLEMMGNDFGDYRWTSENELYYWNGLPVFSDRSADPSEPDGLRYQEWNGELTGVYLFDNMRNKKVLEFMIIALNDNLTLYSLDHLGLLSPDDAKELSVTGLPALPENRDYITPMALIYRIRGNIYYHIPIYIETNDQYYPAYFSLVDCQSRTLFRESTEEYGGLTETAGVLYERAGGSSLLVEEEIITGALEDKDIWVESGNTRMWLTISINATEIDVLVKAELISTQEMHKLLDKEIGETITVKVDEDGTVVEVIE